VISVCFTVFAVISGKLKRKIIIVNDFSCLILVHSIYMITLDELKYKLPNVNFVIVSVPLSYHFKV